MSAICVGGFIEKNNKFLLVKETNGKYNFPMGNLEPSETIEAGCIREVLEETGMKTRIIKLRNILHIKRGDFYLTKFLFNLEIVELNHSAEIDEDIEKLVFVDEEEFYALNRNGLLRSKDMVDLYEKSNNIVGYYES